MRELANLQQQMPDFSFNVSEAGYELLSVEQPEEISEAFIAQTLRQTWQAGDKGGYNSTVSLVSDRPDWCVKQANRPNPYVGLDLQMDYMEALRTRFDDRQEQMDHGIYVPRHYMTATDPKGMQYMLMERADAGNIKEVYPDLSRRDSSNINNRVLHALGRSVLRVGLDDFYHRPSGRLNTGNVLAPRGASRPDVDPLYLIDLPGNRKHSVRAALALNR